MTMHNACFVEILAIFFNNLNSLKCYKNYLWRYPNKLDQVGWKGEKGNEFPDLEKTENKIFSERWSGRMFSRKKERKERKK